MKIKKEKTITDRKTQVKHTFKNNIVYFSNTDLGWAIIIEPDDIIIDNYHINISHIHLNPKKHFLKKTIKEQDPCVLLKIVLKHICRNERLILDELKEELKLS